MPFSSLSDPSDLARAHAVMEVVWNDLKEGIPEARREHERTRLAYLIASSAALALDEDDLRQNVLRQFKERAPQNVAE